MSFTFSGPNGISPADGEICLIKTEEKRVQGLKKNDQEGGDWWNHPLSSRVVLITRAPGRMHSVLNLPFDNLFFQMECMQISLFLTYWSLA